MSIKDKLNNKYLEAFEEAVIQAEDLLTRKGLGKSLEEEELDEDLEIVEEPEEAAEQEDLPQQPSPCLNVGNLCEQRNHDRTHIALVLHFGLKNPPFIVQVSKYSNILSYIRQAKSTLKQILNGTKPSERHKIYTCGRVSERDQLKHRAGFGPIGDENLGDEIMTLLLKFHNEFTGNKDLSYVADVWLPEAIIWSIQKIDHVDRERAEKMFLKGSSYAVSAAEVKELNTKLKQRKLSSEETKERIEKAERAMARSAES
ncbi:nucleosome binding [Desmophyllum pertusum]|uniref:Nucleosome binding n=1 Tax=Desmophyllum pertusum TaxID=174260 RepID=A0A9X0D3P9_9CNID|nr:nucleosome binding [Desmophyllum pertusum]